MLNNEQRIELRQFLNRLQGQEVRLEIMSRLNEGFRQSFKVKLGTEDDSYTFVSESGENSFFLNPAEAEAMKSDTSSVTLLYGDEMISVRFARKR